MQHPQPARWHQAKRPLRQTSSCNDPPFPLPLPLSPRTIPQELQCLNLRNPSRLGRTPYDRARIRSLQIYYPIRRSRQSQSQRPQVKAIDHYAVTAQQSRLRADARLPIHRQTELGPMQVGEQPYKRGSGGHAAFEQMLAYLYADKLTLAQGPKCKLASNRMKEVREAISLAKHYNLEIPANLYKTFERQRPGSRIPR